MMKYTSTLLVLLLSGTFVGCGNNNDTEIKKDTNTSTAEVPKEETTSPIQEQKMPTCYIKKGTPLTDSMITVHVRCKKGNIPIDEAKVTLDHTVKPVKYKGVYFSDYIGFRNLQPSTTYKAILEVIVGGKTIKKSVKIKTREEKVVVTQIPTPTPMVYTSPKWIKDSYELYLRSLNIPHDRTILDLNKLCSSKGDITYKIVSSHFQQNTIPQDSDYNLENELTIDNGKLKLDDMPYNGGLVLVIIRATSNHKSSDASIKITLEPLYLP